MLKWICAIIMIVAQSSISFCQDLIVTSNNDSIHCKLVSTKGEYLQFTVGEETEVRKIPKGVVSYYEKGAIEGQPESDKEKSKALHFSKVRLGIESGFNYLTAPTNENIPDELKGHIKNIRSGYHVKMDFSYFIKRNFGFGFTYAVFKSKAETQYGVTPSGYVLIQKDDITNNFIAPSINIRLPSRNEFVQSVLSLSPGLLTYKNNSSIGELTSKTFGMLFDLGVDFKVVRNFYMGVSVSYLAGTLTKYEVQGLFGSGPRTIELDEENYESLARISISAGIRFYK